MNRRTFVSSSLKGAGVALAVGAPASGSTALRANGAVPDPQGIVKADAVQLQSLMQRGALSATALTRFYLDRIEALDKAGPKLNSIIELNPDALQIAAELDKERKAGKVRGPLHGLAVLLKDNIATADTMSTSAGSLALAGVRAKEDAHIVTQLRAVGAVILGKTNLSEWANLRSTRSTSGWSARGGLTLNPYALDRNTSGSSSGSGAAMAASLASLAVGTETDGSIVSPASIGGLVGIKPTLGVVSRSGIIPLAHSQDTAGPMARTVRDAALLLQALAGADASDAITQTSKANPADFTTGLNPDALKGARIGVARNFFGSHDEVDAVMEQALKVLQAQGAVLVDPVEVPNITKYNDSELEVLLYEFKADLPLWLARYAPHAPIKNMADVIAFNLQHADQELKFFGQEYLVRAQAKAGLDSKDYIDALATNHRYARAEGLDQVLKEHNLDALVAPTTGLGWLTDFINGDHGAGGFSSPAAVAGYPHITVPAGQVHGLPVGLSFVGAAFSDARLIRFAYAYEQASWMRRAPTYARSLSRKASR
jgi:amidase